MTRTRSLVALTMRTMSAIATGFSPGSPSAKAPSASATMDLASLAVPRPLNAPKFASGSLEPAAAPTKVHNTL